MAKIKEFLKSKTLWVGAASFMLPSLVLYIIFACNGVHPFGDKQIIVTDFWHQYYPFLCEMQEKLQAGESLLYSHDLGLGVNFWALIAYYCASPLNFLILFVSKEGLRDLLTVIVTLKIGFAGLFFSLYLKKVFKKYDYTVVAFSALYALCGYVLGYYWNIMWLDSMALLPLVMLGVYLIIKENKYLLYIISLAICVISNFYIGYMVCIFTAIYFFAECLRTKVKIGGFFKKLGIIIGASVLGLALTAFMTLPAYNSLGNTVSTASSTNETVAERITDFFESVPQYGKEIVKDGPGIIGRTLSFNQPVPKEGLPNIFSGFICIILLGYFLCAKNISLREKLVTSAMILILLLSLTINDIDIIWHGMHKPNMVPYRYAFVFSFVMITTAYRAFDAIGESSKKNQRIMFTVSFLLSALTIICAVNEDVITSVKKFMSDGTQIEESMVATILGCCAIAIVYYILLHTYLRESGKAKDKWCKALCGVIVAEIIINTVIAVPTVRTTVYSTYYYRGEEIEKLLETVDADSSYGRVESAQEYILNDPALYGFKGVSLFSSTANYPVTQLMGKLAICAPGKANRYYYETTSPLTNAFLGIEHIIFRNGMKNLNPYLELVAAEKNEKGSELAAIYKNTETLPIGFMTDEALLGEGGLIEGNPFEIQNDLFKKATGLEEDLFTRVDISTVPSTNTVRIKGGNGKYSLTLDEGHTEKKMGANYIVPDENSLYAYIDGSTIASVKVSDTTYKAVKRKYIFPVGKYDAGKKITFDFAFESTFKQSGNMEFHVYSMNEALFEEGMKILRDEPFNITSYEPTKIEGTISANTDGAFYTSIPYEKGWKAYVDGKETTITPFENALIAFNLTAGEHDITLEFTPDGFAFGRIVSLTALGVLIVLIVIHFLSKKQRRIADGQDIDNSALL